MSVFFSYFGLTPAIERGIHIKWIIFRSWKFFMRVFGKIYHLILSKIEKKNLIKNKNRKNQSNSEKNNWFKKKNADETNNSVKPNIFRVNFRFIIQVSKSTYECDSCLVCQLTFCYWICREKKNGVHVCFRTRKRPIRTA